MFPRQIRHKHSLRDFQKTGLQRDTNQSSIDVAASVKQRAAAEHAVNVRHGIKERVVATRRSFRFNKKKKEAERKERRDAPSGTMARERACECAVRNRVILLSSRSIGLEESHSFEPDGPGIQTHAHIEYTSVTSNRAATAFRRHENCLLYGTSTLLPVFPSCGVTSHI